MKKVLTILVLCSLVLGLMFGCTEITNQDNTSTNGSGNVVNQPDNTNNTNNGAVTGEPIGSEIPMPPALPE
jgi:hypothetical protein